MGDEDLSPILGRLPNGFHPLRKRGQREAADLDRHDTPAFLRHPFGTSHPVELIRPVAAGESERKKRRHQALSVQQPRPNHHNLVLIAVRAQFESLLGESVRPAPGDVEHDTGRARQTHQKVVGLGRAEVVQGELEAGRRTQGLESS
jgi:hypothetical protein